MSLSSSPPPPLLTIQSIHNTIDECLSKYDDYAKIQMTVKEESSPPLSLKKFRCRRGVEKDMNSIQAFYSNFVSSSTSQKYDSNGNRKFHPPHYYIILEEKIPEENHGDGDGDVGGNNNDNNNGVAIKGVGMWYFGYSTWKGKVMNLDTLLSTGLVEEKVLMDVLVKIAQCLNLGRIVYQIQGTNDAETFAKTHNTEFLKEWLTLQMDRDAMSSFLSTKSKYDSALCNPNTDTATDTNTSSEDERNQNLVQKTATTTNHTISLENIHETIDLILSKINPAVGRRCMSNISHGNHGSSKFRLRRAEHPSDAEAIYQLVKGLALYEKALEEVDVNETIYQLDSSGENPFYHCILLELDQVQMGTDVDNTNNDTSNKVVGMGFFYFGSSMTNNKNSPSPFLYLEDLFIEEEYRGNGFGKSIMYVLAEISKELGCERFVWQALEWNFPALKFYNSIGAKICDGLTTLRLSRENLV